MQRNWKPALRALFAVAAVWAASAPAQEAEEDEVRPLEAVQERRYRMQHEVALSLGVVPNDPFTKGLYGQFGYTAHFTDTFAWNVARGAYVYNVKTDLRTQLERDFSQPPTAFDQIQFFVGSDLMWTPIYGKISVANTFDIHGEFFLYVGGTMFKFTNSFRPGVNFGLGGRVFLNRAFSVRLDVSDDVVLPIGAPRLGNVMQTSLSISLNIGATE